MDRETLLTALQKFEKASPMKCVIVSSEAEFAAALESHAKEGRRLAAVSNIGLAEPLRRLTFLPASAFKDG